MRFLILQHAACETPGVYEEILVQRGAALTRVELDEGEPLPPAAEFDGILAMGGPMSVNDDASLPWLGVEKRLVRDAVRTGKPFWGVCLGAQLLAASLGAAVYPGPCPEVGLMTVDLTEAALTDPVLRGTEPGLLTLQWHGETFDIPSGGVLLASSPVCPNQAFRVGATAYGLQFHMEVTPEMARAWALLPEYDEALERALGPGALQPLIQDLVARGEAVNLTGRRWFERWLDLLGSVKE